MNYSIVSKSSKVTVDCGKKTFYLIYLIIIFIGLFLKLELKYELLNVTMDLMNNISKTL